MLRQWVVVEWIVVMVLVLLTCHGKHVSSSNTVNWCDRHQTCRLSTSAASIDNEPVVCSDQMYLQYFLALAQNPPTPFHAEIAAAVINLYSDIADSITKHTYVIRNESVIEDHFPILSSTLRNKNIPENSCNVKEGETANNWIFSIYPMSISIAEEMIAAQVPPKVKSFGRVIPGNRSTYFGYDQEEMYHSDMRDSLFTITCQEVGWDCMRHYEILAAGSLPLFIDIDYIEQQRTEVSFPTSLALHPIRLYQLIAHYPSISCAAKRTDAYQGQYLIENFTFQYPSEGFDKQLYTALTMATLQLTRNVFSSKEMASYLIQAVQQTCKNEGLRLGENNQIRRVLFLSNNFYDSDDYMVDTLLHGLKKLLGEHSQVVVNVHRRQGTHRNLQQFAADSVLKYKRDLYGHGMTYALKLDTLSVDQFGFDVSDYDIDHVADMISHHDFDLIIHGSAHRHSVDRPESDAILTRMWPLVCRYYARHEVVLVDGMDHGMHSGAVDRLLPCASHVFSREGIRLQRSDPS